MTGVQTCALPISDDVNFITALSDILEPSLRIIAVNGLANLLASSTGEASDELAGWYLLIKHVILGILSHWYSC